MSLADNIRSFTFQAYVRPALTSGRNEMIIRAGDVHRDMGLQNRMPAVCGALGSKIFETQFGLELLWRTGPHQGANATFRFRMSDVGRVSIKSNSFEQRHHISKSVRTSFRSSKDVPGTVYLISCVGKKRECAAPARDLYVSDWFKKARKFVEARDCPWFILSAKHGLVAPHQLLEPYEVTLNTMSVADRRIWARKVIGQMTEKMPRSKNVVFLAGQRYREFLEDKLRNQGVSVVVPMAGLRIGEQLAWLGAQIDDGQAE